MTSACPYVGALANVLSDLHSADMNDAASLGKNVKELRQARGQTQGQLAKLAGIPRATWANLESGTANPTLSVMLAVARGLQVPLEELVSQPRAACKFYARADLPTKKRGAVTVRKLLPDAIAGMEIDRFELPPRSHMIGVPHTPGTREYLTCEKGKITLVAASETWELGEGDVVVFNVGGVEGEDVLRLLLGTGAQDKGEHGEKDESPANDCAPHFCEAQRMELWTSVV